MDLKISLTEQELALAPYIAKRYSVELDPNDTAEQQAEKIAARIKKILISAAKNDAIAQAGSDAKVAKFEELGGVDPVPENFNPFDPSKLK